MEFQEPDAAKWGAPATRGEVAMGVGLIREVLIEILGVTSALAEGDSIKMDKHFKAWIKKDDKVVEFMNELVGKENSKAK